MLEENPAVDPDLSRARATLEAYAPRDEEQARFRTDLIAWIDEHPEDAHRRSCLEGHLTASVLLVDHTRERVLLHHHRNQGHFVLRISGADAGTYGAACTSLG